jgi:hypothetical protein
MRKHGWEQPLLPRVSISCLKDLRVARIAPEDFAKEAVFDPLHIRKVCSNLAPPIAHSLEALFSWCASTEPVAGTPASPRRSLSADLGLNELLPSCWIKHDAHEQNHLRLLILNQKQERPIHHHLEARGQPR